MGEENKKVGERESERASECAGKFLELSLLICFQLAVPVRFQGIWFLVGSHEFLSSRTNLWLPRCPLNLPLQPPLHLLASNFTIASAFKVALDGCMWGGGGDRAAGEQLLK